MDDKALRNAFRRGWLLLLVGILYTAGFFYLAVQTNTPERAPAWDMDGTPFIPASSPYADGYPMPLNPPGQQDREPQAPTPSKTSEAP